MITLNERLVSGPQIAGLNVRVWAIAARPLSSGGGGPSALYPMAAA